MKISILAQKLPGPVYSNSLFLGVFVKFVIRVHRAQRVGSGARTQEPTSVYCPT